MDKKKSIKKSRRHFNCSGGIGASLVFCQKPSNNNTDIYCC